MAVSDKLKALRKRSGLSMAEVARRAGWSQPSSYQRYEDDRLFTRPYLPTEIAEKLCQALVGEGSPPISATEIMALSGQTRQPSVEPWAPDRVVEVIAVVEAGAWREAIEFPVEEREIYPRPHLPGYERMKVFALRVRGNSMNEIYPDGSVAYFVRPSDLTPVEGNIVVVSAKRGALYEATLKELRRDPKGRRALCPRSTDARFKAPIYPDETGADIVEIIGVAIGKFEMLPSPIGRAKR